MHTDIFKGQPDHDSLSLRLSSWIILDCVEVAFKIKHLRDEGSHLTLGIEHLNACE